MKSVLLSLSFTFFTLISTTSCQSQGTRSLKSHDEIRNDFMFRNDVRLEREVARIIKTASRTQNVQFVGTTIH